MACNYVVHIMKGPYNPYLLRVQTRCTHIHHHHHHNNNNNNNNDDNNNNNNTNKVFKNASYV